MITGHERRRRWTDEDRNRILAAIEEPGAVVAEVARHEDICTSLVYKWRREARQAAANTPGFAKLMVEDATPVAALTLEAEHAAIFVDMGSTRIRIGANASAVLIAATLKALRS